MAQTEEFRRIVRRFNKRYGSDAIIKAEEYARKHNIKIFRTRKKCTRRFKKQKSFGFSEYSNLWR